MAQWSCQGQLAGGKRGRLWEVLAGWVAQVYSVAVALVRRWKLSDEEADSHLESAETGSSHFYYIVCTEEPESLLNDFWNETLC